MPSSWPMVMTPVPPTPPTTMPQASSGFGMTGMKLPLPVIPNAEEAWGVVVGGVGGTGVITIGQLLGMIRRR